MKFARRFEKLGRWAIAIALVVCSWTLLTQPATAATHTVKMGADNGALEFVPPTLTIAPGDKVVFLMNKLGPHNAVFDKGPPGVNLEKLSQKQLMFSSGQSYSTTFPANAPAGSYHYYCQPHRGAGMVGEIVVQ